MSFQHIKVMADYFCFPLWEDSPIEVGNIDPNDLPISQELKADLMAWARTLDEDFNEDDPGNSRNISEEERWAFSDKGYCLARRLREELGEDFPILYHISG